MRFRRNVMGLLRRALALPAVALSLLFVGICLVGAGYVFGVQLPAERAELVAHWRARLDSIADRQREAVDRWLSERSKDADVIGDYPTLRWALGERSSGAPPFPTDASPARHLRDLLESERVASGYLSVRAFDDRLQEVASVGTPEGKACRALARRVLSAGTRQHGLHHHDQRLALAAAVPVRDRLSSRVLGIVVVEADPGDWLYPLLRETVPTRTGETVLVARDADSIVFLSPLRHRPVVPLSMRLPMTTPGLAAARIWRNGPGFGEYVDYRQKPVVASVRRLSIEDWGLVAKVDLDEVLAPLAEDRAEGLILVVAIALGLTGLAYGAWWRLRREVAGRVAAHASDLAAALQHSRDVIVFLDRDGVVYDIWGDTRRLYGLPGEALIGRRVSEFRIPEEAEQARREYERAWELGSHQYEAQHLSADGRVVDVEVTTARVELAGEPRLLAIVRDATWRREAGQRIRYLNRVLRMLLAINEAMVRADDADSFLAESCRLAAVHGDFSAVWIAWRQPDAGWRTRALAGLDQDLVDAIANRTLGPQVDTDLDQLAASGHAERRVTGGRTGSPAWQRTLETHGVGVRAASPVRVAGVVVGVLVLYARKPAQLDEEFLPLLEQLAGDIGFALETLEGRERERRAGEGLRKLSRAVQQSTSGVLITDTAGRIEYVNPRFTEITGYSAEESLGRNPRILNSGENPPSLYAEMWGTLLAGREWSGELRNRRKNGEAYWARLSISSIRDEAGSVTHYLALQDDVSEEKKIGVQLTTLQRQLSMAQKMEAVGRLAGGVAHDFNNVLGVITGYAEMLLRRDVQQPGPRRKLEQILEAADRAAGLTRQLLAFSRRQELQPRVLDLNERVREVERLLRRVIGEDIELRLMLAPDLGRVRVDPTQLDQIVINLAANARDAMPTGGPLLIETRNADVDATLAPVHEPMRPGPYARLSITDQGVGMPPEVLAHIFEPFYTTKPEGQGTGLGLATVYGIVKQSEGYIWPYSEPGKGTSFHIYLPRVPDPAEPVPSEDAVAAPGRGELVLLVEDQASLRELTIEMLMALGYRVRAASSGENAEVLAARQDRIDLLLSDVVMPGCSGPELAQRLVASRPDLKVLFMSGYTDEMLVRHGAADERLHLLQKPFTLDQLARRVRQALADERPADRPGTSS